MNDLNPNLDIWSKDLPIWERGQAGGRTRPIDRDALFRNLVEVSSCLTKHGIKHWLSHGTMLGAYRDQNFIAWDDDVDISLDFSQRKQIYPVIDEMRAAGYIVTEGDPTRPIDKDNAPYYDTNFIRDGEKIEGWWFEKEGDFYVYDKPRCGYSLKHPAKYYDDLQDFVFRGVTFKIPNHIEDWLTMMYDANWRIPNKDKKYNHA